MDENAKSLCKILVIILSDNPKAKRDSRSERAEECTIDCHTIWTFSKV